VRLDGRRVPAEKIYILLDGLGDANENRLERMKLMVKKKTKLLMDIIGMMGGYR